MVPSDLRQHTPTFQGNLFSKVQGPEERGLSHPVSTLEFASPCGLPGSERSIGTGSLGGICPARLISTICVF